MGSIWGFAILYHVEKVAFDALGSPVFSLEMAADSVESRDAETWEEALGFHSVLVICGSEFLRPVNQVPGLWLPPVLATQVRLIAAQMDLVPPGFLEDPICTKPVCAAGFSPDQELDGDSL